jgi:hypothetical protein
MLLQLAELTFVSANFCLSGTRLGTPSNSDKASLTAGRGRVALRAALSSRCVSISHVRLARMRASTLSSVSSRSICATFSLRDIGVNGVAFMLRGWGVIASRGDGQSANS